MTDEELVIEVQKGTAGAADRLIARYEGLVLARSRRFFLTGADREDIVQEGMIGLSMAIGSFQPTFHVSFACFADRCVCRQIQSAVRTSLRQKHRALNLAQGTILKRCQTDTGQSYEVVESATEEGFATAEMITILVGTADLLTELEGAVLDGYLTGRSYSEMSGILGCPSKCIDNALQRARKKIAACLSAE
jgi:RNA polymerase sporulation-specific sigma factor